MQQAANSVRRSKLDKSHSAEFAHAQQTARARLYPSIFANNFLVLSNRRRRMQIFFEGLPFVGDVLDVGAQYCPYLSTLQGKVHVIHVDGIGRYANRGYRL